MMRNSFQSFEKYNSLPMELLFKRTDASDGNFRSLVALLDADLAVRDGTDHSFYNQFNKIDTIRHVILCYADAKPIACGAFKPFNDDSVEVKRMFILPEYRGQGIGEMLLKVLEKWAGELGYKHSVLETGKKQPDAIRLYEKAGYHRIPNYGQYENVENSVCMRKAIISG
jgi:putative acetyltransferase